MKNRKQISTAYILGAGFSWNFGLPLQSEFTKALITLNNASHIDLSNLLIWTIRRFIRLAFHTTSQSPFEVFPSLEDIFTCIDLSSNSGLNFGRGRSPSYLRTIRRILISRIIQILNDSYKPAEYITSFVKHLDLSNSAFIVLNWDTSLEKCLIKSSEALVKGINYLVDCSPFNGNSVDPSSPKIIKPHGSSNWLYCDCCRSLYYVDPIDETKLPLQIVKKTDWQTIRSLDHVPRGYKGIIDRISTSSRGWLKLKCSICNTILSTRLATFSYRKDFGQPFFQHAWFMSERILLEADEWVFIGYSLPEADYEFKHLLKRVQLVKNSDLKLKVVLKENADNYFKLFGSRLKIENVFLNGLEGYTISLNK